MSEFSSQIASIDAAFKTKMELQDKIDALVEQIDKSNQHYVVMLEAQKLLTTVSDDNTTAVLDYITGIINKALGELFPYDKQRIYLEKKMHGGQHAHIVVNLETEDGKERSLTLQTGTGLRQIISFLFILSLIEIRKTRKILLMDELLSGLHDDAKAIIVDIMKIFAEEGFQFIMVEYGIDTYGKIYLVEKPNKEATVTPLEGEYNNQVFMFNRPVEEVDKSLKIVEEEPA